MTLTALKHLLHSATALAADRRFFVLGSASLLVSFPELGDEDSLLSATYDADLCPDPFDELTGTMPVDFSGCLDRLLRMDGIHLRATQCPGM